MSEPGTKRAGLVVALLALLISGCAAIPTSGPVRSGGDLRPQRPNDGVPFIGESPQPGASPENVVLGFLQSSADFADDHAVAREYLTPTARQGWRPQAGTVVYDRITPAPSVQSGSSGSVTVQGSEVGRVDGDGRFVRSPTDTPFSRAFQLQRVDGEWRIAGLTDGLVLSSPDVLETFRPLNLYFLAPSGKTLVPDPVLVPESAGMATKLVTRLLRGPTVGLRGAVTTAFPPGTGLEVGSVPVRDGVATVRLDSSALQADDTQREQMSAQLVWTLKQLPEVEKVRILAGGEDLVVSGVAREQSRDAWLQYDPDRLPSNPSAYVVSDGRVGRYLEGGFEPAAGASGTGSPPLRSPAVTLDAARVAAVGTDGRTVYVGQLTRGGTLEQRLRGADLSAPSWDRGNNLWVVDRPTGVLWYLADGADKPQQVAVPRLPGGQPPSAVSVSRDGARVALVTGTGRTARLVVGAVRRAETADPDVAGGETLSVVQAAAPLPDLQSVRDVAWSDATTLAVLGSRDGTAVTPFYTAIDGYTVEDIEPQPELVTLTAVPPRGSPLVAGTADGQLLQFTSGGGWTALGVGSDPAYPG